VTTGQLEATEAVAARSRASERALAALNQRLAGLPLPRAATTLYVVSALWSVVFAIVAAVKYSQFQDRRYDLGNFTQAVWTTAHGHFLETTNVAGAQVSRLGIHVDPIIAAFAPLWWLWPSPAVLLTAQAIALGAGAIPLFWLARKHLGRDRDAAFVAFAYLLCPSVGLNTLTEFHAAALAVPLLLLAVWFLDEERLVAFAGCAFAAMLCQEIVGLTIVCLGAWFGLRTRRWRAGAAIVGGGLLATAIDFELVLRHFGGGTPYSGRYAAVGGSIGGIAKTALSDPTKILGAVQVSDLVNPVILLLPVLGLSLLSPVLIAALPQAILLTLSSNKYDWSYKTQNVLLVVPFVYAAAALALGKRDRRIRAEHVFTLSLVLGLVLGPSLTPKGPPAPQLRAERHAVSLIPAGARVSATNYLGSHLAARRYLYVFPDVSKADWVVVDTADPYLPPRRTAYGQERVTVGMHDLYLDPELTNRTVRQLQHDRAWRQVYAASTVHVFEHRGT
jgi:uncharacterized membrane protein